MKRWIQFIAAAWIASPAAWAHGGEDHGGEDHGASTPFAETLAAPRVEAQSEDFELVAVLSAEGRMLYLDRYADNAPVADAEIEIEGDGFKAAATQIAPGLYRAPALQLARPGRHPLTISVQAGESADLLTATLEIVAPAKSGKPASSQTAWAAWGAAAVALSLGAGWLVLRRRNRG